MGIFNRIFEELEADGISLDWALIEASPLKAQGTAVRLLKKGMFPVAASARERNSSKDEYICDPKHFTTVTLEPELLDALKEIAATEGCSVRGLCTLVYESKNPTVSLAATLRVFIVEYYRGKSKSEVTTLVSEVLARIKPKPTANRR